MIKARLRLLMKFVIEMDKSNIVAYAEHFYGEGVHSVARGGNLYLVCAVCDVTI